MKINLTFFSKTVLVFALLTIMASSCVTRKMYDDLEAKKLQADSDLKECQTSLDQTEEEVKDLNKEIEKFKDQVLALKTDTNQLGMGYRKMKRLYNDINTSYERLLTNYNRLLSNSAAEAGKLNTQLAQREQDLMQLEKNLNESKKQIEQMAIDLEKREQKVKELEAILAQKEEAVNALREKVGKALLGFKEKDLSVEIKNGKVYVSLSDELLFQSGSYAVDNRGKEALTKLAEVLKDNEEVNILVEGHTDDVPVNAKGVQVYKNNWELSVLRATSIVRLLVDNGVQGRRLMAAGRSKYHPVVDADNKEARKKNRRTEIILTPQLDELFQLLEAN